MLWSPYGSLRSVVAGSETRVDSLGVLPAEGCRLRADAFADQDGSRLPPDHLPGLPAVAATLQDLRRLSGNLMTKSLCLRCRDCADADADGERCILRGTRLRDCDRLGHSSVRRRCQYRAGC